MKKIVLVGKANSGKSTLFNLLVGKNIAMVGDTKGLTRDLIKRKISRNGQYSILIDSGGLGARFTDEVGAKRDEAIEQSDKIIFMCDATSRFDDEDEKIYKKILRSKKPFISVLNKVDNKICNIDKSFYRLGNFYKISAKQRRIEQIISFMFENSGEEAAAESDASKIAIVGRPNAGKSSIVNRILNKDQNIVSDIPGTTIDTIDSLIKTEYGNFILIDTAGLTRKKKDSDWEIAKAKALAMIAASKIVMLIFDITEGITKEDTLIASNAIHNKKGLLLVANKIDKIDSDITKYERWFRSYYKFLSYYPLILTSAKTSRNFSTIVKRLKSVEKSLERKISKKELDQFTDRYLPKIGASYIYQKNETYPLFVIKVQKGYNDRNTKYIRNRLYKDFDFYGAPVEVRVIKKERRQ
ncbi:MAG: GTPase Der [bacterium]|nr:MAG: GTPase Der [bacterium]